LCVNIKHTNLIQQFLPSSSVFADGKANNLYGGEHTQESCLVPYNSQIYIFRYYSYFQLVITIWTIYNSI